MKLIVAVLFTIFVLTTNGSKEKVRWECPDCPSIFSYSNYVPKDKNPNRLSTKQLHQQKCKNRNKKALEERIAEEKKNKPPGKIAEENREGVEEGTQKEGSNYEGGEFTKQFVKFVDQSTERLQEGGKLTQRLVTNIFGKFISLEAKTELLEKHSEDRNKREQIDDSIEKKGILFEDIVGKSEEDIDKEKKITENIQTSWRIYDQQKLTQELMTKLFDKCICNCEEAKNEFLPENAGEKIKENIEDLKDVSDIEDKGKHVEDPTEDTQAGAHNYEGLLKYFNKWDTEEKKDLSEKITKDNLDKREVIEKTENVVNGDSEEKSADKQSANAKNCFFIFKLADVVNSALKPVPTDRDEPNETDSRGWALNLPSLSLLQQIDSKRKCLYKNCDDPMKTSSYKYKFLELKDGCPEHRGYVHLNCFFDYLPDGCCHPDNRWLKLTICKKSDYYTSLVRRDQFWVHVHNNKKIAYLMGMLIILWVEGFNLYWAFWWGDLKTKPTDQKYWTAKLMFISTVLSLFAVFHMMYRNMVVNFLEIIDGKNMNMLVYLVFFTVVFKFTISPLLGEVISLAVLGLTALATMGYIRWNGITLQNVLLQFAYWIWICTTFGAAASYIFPNY